MFEKGQASEEELTDDSDRLVQRVRNLGFWRGCRNTRTGPGKRPLCQEKRTGQKHQVQSQQKEVIEP
jgi:hypothetical protein